MLTRILYNYQSQSSILDDKLMAYITGALHNA
jgi:hypothetical protein